MLINDFICTLQETHKAQYHRLGCSHPIKVCHSSQMFSPAMIIATAHANSFNHKGLTNSLIRRRSLVNMTSGKTAKDNCKLRMTWLKTSKPPVLFSPKKIIVSELPNTNRSTDIVWASSFADNCLYRCLATRLWSYTLSTRSSASP